MGNDDSELSDDRVVDCHKLSKNLLGDLEIIKCIREPNYNSMVVCTFKNISKVAIRVYLVILAFP